MSASKLESGGVAVVAAVGQAPIRTWLDVVWNYDDMTYQHCLLVGNDGGFCTEVGSFHQQAEFSIAGRIDPRHRQGADPARDFEQAWQLSTAEMRTMRTHPAIGYDMLRHQPELDGQLREIVRSHHEYLDGSGYPNGLRGDQISNFIRIVTVCDIYGALIEPRSCRVPMPPEQALACLVDMGGKLDGGLVSAFHGMIGPSYR